MLNNLPDLNRIRTFYAVFEAKSLTRASHELHVTRSAVSQALKNLEEEIGEKLFIRSGKEIFPTDSGKSLYELIAPFLANLELQMSDLRDAKLSASGTVRVGAPPLFMTEFLIPAIAEFNRSHPLVRFEIENCNSAQQLGQVIGGRLHFAVVDSLDVFAKKLLSLGVTDLLSEAEVMVCSKNYAQSHLKSLGSFEGVSQCHFISYSDQASDILAWFQSTFKKKPTNITRSLTVETVHGVLSGIRNHLGLGMVPIRLAAADLRRGLLVQPFKKSGHFTNKMSLVYLNGRTRSLAEELFQKHLTGFLKKGMGK